MTVKKQFAEDSTSLDNHVDELLEVLVQLLEEPQYPLAVGPANLSATAATADLRPGSERVTHVVVRNPTK